MDSLFAITETQEAIQANAANHTRLLNTIAKLQYAPSALKHQIAYVGDLEKELDESEKRVAELAEITKKERKEHEALRDSTTRRLAHKLLGKKEQFKEKESKEEREYVEALEREIKERDNLSVVQRLLGEAQTLLADLTDKATEFGSAKTELAGLYDRIFEGPSEDFPEDDRLEYLHNDASKRHKQLQSLANAENLAVELLEKAGKAMEECRELVQGAQLSSNVDLLPDRPATEEEYKTNPLRKAELKINETDSLMKRAMNASSVVNYVRRVDLPMRLLVGDIILNGPHWKKAFELSLKKTIAQADFVYHEVKGELIRAKRRANAANEQLAEISKELELRRRELDEYRRQAFEMYLAQHPPPPEYKDIKQSTAPLDPPPEFRGLPITSFHEVGQRRY